MSCARQFFHSLVRQPHKNHIKLISKILSSDSSIYLRFVLLQIFCISKSPYSKNHHGKENKITETSPGAPVNASKFISTALTNTNASPIKAIPGAMKIVQIEKLYCLFFLKKAITARQAMKIPVTIKIHQPLQTKGTDKPDLSPSIGKWSA